VQQETIGYQTNKPEPMKVRHPYVDSFTSKVFITLSAIFIWTCWFN